jgi:hypothetical protein
MTAVLAVAVLSASACGPAPVKCDEWIGTYQGSFNGTVDGHAFNLSGSQFQIQVTAISGSATVVGITEALLSLGSGYTLELTAYSLACNNPQLDLKTGTNGSTYCTVKSTTKASDNCDFNGALFKSGLSSGSFAAPASGDQSPTYTGSGTWTLNR